MKFVNFFLRLQDAYVPLTSDEKSQLARDANAWLETWNPAEGTLQAKIKKLLDFWIVRLLIGFLFIFVSIRLGQTLRRLRISWDANGKMQFGSDEEDPFEEEDDDDDDEDEELYDKHGNRVYLH